MEVPVRNGINLLRNERGSVLLLSLFILMILTVLGIAASNTSTLEIRMAANERDYQRAVYAAESGIAHMRARLQNQLVSGNQAKIASNTPIDWDFALTGPEATGFNNSIGMLNYFVRVYNNNDGGSATDDTDQNVYVRSDGSGPNNSRASVEVMLNAGVVSEGLTGYTAQAGAGAGKNYNSNDVDAITDTTTNNLGNL